MQGADLHAQPHAAGSRGEERGGVAPPVGMHHSPHLGGSEGVALVLRRRHVNNAVAAPGNEGGTRQHNAALKGSMQVVPLHASAAADLASSQPLGA